MADGTLFALVDVIKQGGAIALAIVFATLYWRADHRERQSLNREHRLAVQGVEVLHEVKATLDKLGVKLQRGPRARAKSKRGRR